MEIEAEDAVPAPSAGKCQQSSDVRKHEVSTLPDGDTAYRIEAAFRRRQKSWEQEFLLDPQQPRLGSWLLGQRVSSRCFQLVCLACRAFEGQKTTDGVQLAKNSNQSCGLWAKGRVISSTKDLRKWLAQKHAQAPEHLRATLHFLSYGDKAQVEGEEPNLQNAPPVSQLMDIWKSMHKGLSCRAVANDMKDVGRHKMERISSCLHEAVLNHERERLHQVRVMALHQDVRKGILQMRYTACLADWSVASGLLGLDLQPGTLSQELAQASKRILERFCTKDGSTDNSLFQQLSAAVELLDADGASDEQRCLRLLGQNFFTNVKICIKDPTHCARRLATSPWAADPTLSQIHAMYISGPDSMTNLIQRSPDLRTMFQANNGKLDVDELPLAAGTLSKMKAMDYAAHRFESSCKPLCRFVLLFDSIWLTAIDISIKRSGSAPGQRATQFLQDASEESLLQLAMLADASLQNLELVRFYDAESWLLLCQKVVVIELMKSLMG